MRINPLAVVAFTPLFVLAAGCSDSGSSGGSKSTAAGATSAGVTSGSATQNLKPGLTSPLPPAPASQGVAMDVFNGEFQDAWDVMLPGLQAMLQQQAQGMAGSVYSRGAIDIEIVNVQTLASQMLVAPGLTTLTADTLRLRLPRQGSWDLVLEADIRVRITITGSIAPAIDIPVTVTVSDISAEIEVGFDHTDPTRPTLNRVGNPVINFAVRIDSPSPLLAQISPVLTPLANTLTHTALNVALGGLLPSLSGLQGIPGQIPGAGAAPLADSGTAVPFEEIMKRIDQKTRRDNMPHGTLMGAFMDTSATDSWEDAYRQGGPGNVGTVLSWGSGGDSAIFTGQYLAAMAFRYAATGDADALGSLNHTLRGVAKLLDVNGGNGLLARCVAPQGSPVAQSFGAIYKTTQINGQPWVSYQGSYGITRDQYSGVFYGLSIAWELVSDSLVRAECERLLEMMLDYLIANKWVVDEDRGPLGTGASEGPLHWTGVGIQKTTFLLMGHRFNPSKYAAEIAAVGPVSDMAWFGAWTSVLSVDSYYKFNLSHLAHYNYFRLETDMQRWQGYQRAFRILRRYVGHHRNAHFDLIDTTIDPSTSAVYYPQTREVIRQFLRRNHREVAPPVVDLSLVVYGPVAQTGIQTNPGGGYSLGTTTTQMPTEPIDVEIRKYTGHFLWQRDPFSPATPNAGNDKNEKGGLDAVLPYWMGRYYGAF